MVLAHIEVHAAVAHIGIAGIQYALHQFYLLHHMSRGEGLDAGTQHVQCIHCSMVAVGVVLCHLHGFQLLEAGLLGNLVLALVSIVLQMSHVGDVTHIAHLVADVPQIAVQDIERDGRAGMAEMAVAIHRGSAHIHAHMVGRDGFEKLFLMRKSIVNQQLLHISLLNIVLQR